MRFPPFTGSIKLPCRRSAGFFRGTGLASDKSRSIDAPMAAASWMIFRNRSISNAASASSLKRHVQ